MLEQSDASLTDIAIIGMSLRVPGANSVGQFWRNLREGVESIRTRSEEELLAAGESPEKLRDKNYVPRAASLDGMRSEERRVGKDATQRTPLTDREIQQR